MWRIYGDKAADMVEGLMKKPSVAVPLVLRRMRAKLDEWREAQKNYNRLWREQCDKNHAKWQQSQAASFRQVDGRQMRTKTLLNGADTAAEEVSLSHRCIVVIGCWLVNSSSAAVLIDVSMSVCVLSWLFSNRSSSYSFPLILTKLDMHDLCANTQKKLEQILKFWF